MVVQGPGRADANQRLSAIIADQLIGIDRHRGHAHAGAIYSSDTFYDERQDLSDQMQRHAVLAVEMEAAELYTLAARYGRRALAVMTISDHILTHEALPADQRETSFGDMVEIALTAAFA